MNMKKIFLCAWVSAFCVFGFSAAANAQASLVSKGAKEIVKICSKKTGKELAKIGGEKAVRESLEKIAKETSEESVEKVVGYVNRHGISALKAIETSPKNVLKALDGCPEIFQKNLLSAVAKKSPAEISAVVEKAGTNALVLEAKYPSIGFKSAELGGDFVNVMNGLPKEDALIVAKNLKGLAAVNKADPRQFSSKILPALSSGAKKTVETLERNPKVLLAGTALAAWLRSKDELGAPVRTALYVVGGILAVFAGAYLGIKLLFLYRREKSKFGNAAKNA